MPHLVHAGVQILVDVLVDAFVDVAVIYVGLRGTLASTESMA